MLSRDFMPRPYTPYSVLLHSSLCTLHSSLFTLDSHIFSAPQSYEFHPSTAIQAPPRPAMATLVIAIPVELLHQICQNLSQRDLKSCRLVCRYFRFTAEKLLFSHILLRRNVESFTRLRLIADHPEIRNHVQSLCYDPRLFPNSPIWEDFEKWNSAVNGHGHFTISFIQEYADKAERQKLQAHYQRYCALVHSDVPMKNYDVETQDLVNGFARLPHLKEVCFIFTEEDRPSRFRRLSSITQETLIWPDPVHGWLHGKKFAALLEAAHAVQISLKSIKAYGVPWSVFQQSVEVSSRIASATKACEHLAIDVDPNDDPRNGKGSGRENLANMISSSASLHTLEISLGHLGYQGRGNPRLDAKLSEIVDPKLYWPYLKRLKLQALAATDMSLKSLLTHHSRTLRSLDLVHFRLEPYQLDGKKYHGSWIEIIVFLESSLSLNNVRLDGQLSNGVDELWWTEDCGDSDSMFGCPDKGPSLNHLIGRFIVEGGTCPLPFPHDPDKPADWKHLTDFTWNSLCHSRML